MSHHDELTSAKDDYCFAKPGQIYSVYLPSGGTTHLDVGNSSATFTIQWYNPRRGGPLRTGTVRTINGPGSVAIGHPPQDTNKDWVALIKVKR
jgi:hypothetical protein